MQTLNNPFGAVRRAARRLVYGVYEARLSREVAAAPMPRHVGIILDGNRRHGRLTGVNDPDRIYRAGANKLDEILAWSADLGIEMITLWVFSPANLGRPDSEVGGILGAVEAKMRQLVDAPYIHRRGVRLAAIGRRDILPPKLLRAIDEAETATSGNERMTVTLAIGYGGHEEITDAVQALLTEFSVAGKTCSEAAVSVTPDAIRRHLYLSDVPDPDLIIRTSGEIRLSGFLLWQSVHSELHFCDANWPAFRRIDYLRAIRAFQRRERRYGL